MIGFAIPFFKGSDLLRQAIESVIAQRDPDWKLWVSDDGTDPGTQALVESYGDARICYSKNPSRLGMVGNWNRCLELASTEHVTLLHADDTLRPNYVGAFHDGFKRFPQATLLFCGAEIIDDKGAPKFSFPDFYKRVLMPRTSGATVLQSEEGLRLLLRGNFLFCPTVCFRKSLLGGKRFSPQWNMVQDLEMWATLLLAGHQLVGLPEKEYAYRRHSENSTVEYTRNLSRFDEEIRLYETLVEKCEKGGWEKAAAVARRKNIIKLNLAYCAVKDLVALKPRAAAGKLGLFTQLVRDRVETQLR